LSYKPSSFLPYGKQCIDSDDIRVVTDVLNSDWLTTGPKVDEFEKTFAEYLNTQYAISCSNGTAALHLSIVALGLNRGDKVIIPSLTFLSTANAVHFAGADIIFSDVNPDTGLVMKDNIEDIISKEKNIKAILPVHLNGQVSDIINLKKISDKYNIKIIEDACHAIGTTYTDTKKNEFITGDCKFSDTTIFSLHPVKTITAGEGGIITTNNPKYAKKILELRNHGVIKIPEKFVNKDLAFDKNGAVNPWYYEMHDLGFNYRISDINCALALSQLRKLERFVKRRSGLVKIYDNHISRLNNYIKPIGKANNCCPSWHLYPVFVNFDNFSFSRRDFMLYLKENSIGSQVHYLPLHLQPYYQNCYGKINLPGAESYYKKVLSLPLYPSMKDDDVKYIVDTIEKFFNKHSR